MNVKELKELLNTLPDDTEIVMSCDAEGNRFSPLADSSSQYHYLPDTTWSGDLWSEEDERDYDPDIPEDAEVCPPVDAVKALVLWPVN